MTSTNLREIFVTLAREVAMRWRHELWVAAIAGALLGALLFETWLAEAAGLLLPAVTALYGIVAFVLRKSKGGGTSDVVMLRLFVWALFYVGAVATSRVIVGRIAVREADQIVVDIKSYREQHRRCPESLMELSEWTHRPPVCRYPVEYEADGESFGLEIDLSWPLLGPKPRFDGARGSWDE